MSCLANSVLQLKGRVWTEQERQKTEDELFDLAWQIVVLIQTVEHSPEEEQRIGDPAGVGGSTDDKG